MILTSSHGRAAGSGYRQLVAGIAMLVLLVGCGSSDSDSSGQEGAAEPVQAEQCLIWLHGKGGNGGATTLDGGLAVVRPEGTAPGWDGRQWIYAEPGPFDDGVAVITEAADAADCRRIVVHGFSNGASMAAKMYCAGVTLDGRIAGYIIDDPVADASSTDCRPAAGIEVALYWTGSLARSAPPGTACADIDWTCEGPTVGDIADFATQLGTDALDSTTTEHEPHPDPPQVEEWLA